MVAFVLTQPEVLLVIVLEQVTKETHVKMVSTTDATCGGPKKSPRTSSIVQIIFLFRSFEISIDIQSFQNIHV